MRIGELAEAADTTTKTLRYYEDQGLLRAAGRTPGGYRDYTTDTLTRIDFIHRGQAAGLTLAQIRQILDIRDHGQAPCNHVRDLLDTRLTDIDRQIHQLQDLRDTLPGPARARGHDPRRVGGPGLAAAGLVPA